MKSSHLHCTSDIESERNAQARALAVPLLQGKKAINGAISLMQCKVINNQTPTRSRLAPTLLWKLYNDKLRYLDVGYNKNNKAS